MIHMSLTNWLPRKSNFLNICFQIYTTPAFEFAPKIFPRKQCSQWILFAPIIFITLPIAFVGNFLIYSATALAKCLVIALSIITT